MTPLVLVPLFYQLLTAYKPAPPPSQTTIIQSSTISITQTPIHEPKNIGGYSRPYTIAVIGDSMIETLHPGLPDLKNSLSKYFPNLEFDLINLGYPSQNIEDAQRHLEDDLYAKNPDIVVVESFAYNNFGNSQESLNRQWLDLGAITTTISKKLPNTKIIIAATIAPNSVIFANGTNNKFSSLEKIEKTKTIKLYLQNAINFATSQKFPLANAYQYCLDSNNEGNRECINSTDNIHPSEYGAQIFGDTLAKTIFDYKLI